MYKRPIFITNHFFIAMITLKKLKVFNKYNGDEDSFARLGQRDKELITDGEWSFLSNTMQSLDMVRKKVTSTEFAKKTLQELRNVCDPEVYQVLTKGIIV